MKKKKKTRCFKTFRTCNIFLESHVFKSESTSFFFLSPKCTMCWLIRSQVRRPAAEIQPIKWDLHLLALGMPKVLPGHVTRPPVVASQSQATCNPQRALALPRGLELQEVERVRKREDDPDSHLLETIFWWLNWDNNFLYLNLHIYCNGQTNYHCVWLQVLGPLTSASNEMSNPLSTQFNISHLLTYFLSFPLLLQGEIKHW